MMKVTIITLGKLKEKYWKAAEEEYLKRLSTYTKLDIVEIKEEPFRSPNEKEMITKKEAEKVISKIPDGAMVFALHEAGKKFDSPQFADLLEKSSSQGQHLVFVIGGPLGLHDELKNRADTLLSLSALTFPHQMVRTILLEQIYRANTIISGKQYHY